MIEIPLSLREGLRAGTVIPFVGAGVSMAVRSGDGEPLFPSWHDLLLAGAKRLEQEGKPAAMVRELVNEDRDYLAAAERLRDKLGARWSRFLKDQLDVSRSAADERSLELARAIWGLGSRLILTTNYDRPWWAKPRSASRRCWRRCASRVQSGWVGRRKTSSISICMILAATKIFFEALGAELGKPGMKGWKLKRALQDRHIGFCLDGFDKMTYGKFTQEVRSQLRGLADGNNSPLTILTASRQSLEELFPDYPGNTSPLSDIFGKILLNDFLLGTVREFLHYRLKTTGLTFSEADIGWLFLETKGNPGKLQAMAHEIYRRYRIDISISEDSKPVTNLDFYVSSVRSEQSHTERSWLLDKLTLLMLGVNNLEELACINPPIGSADLPDLKFEPSGEIIDAFRTVVASAKNYAKIKLARGRHLLKAQDALERIARVVGEIPRPAPLFGLALDHWRRLFAAAGGELARGEATDPFPQPYVIANPVVGDGFVGRRDILRRLEEFWAVPGQRPSVVLYGHRRMGKSSILQNLRGEQLSADTRIVDFNLQTFGLVPSTGALLHNLALELHDACHQATGAQLAEPDEAPFDREPYGAFQRFLRQLDRRRGELRFIVTLDEFETLEQRIRDGQLQPDLIDFLRGVITTQTWLTLAFAGLHTLQEMTEDYWHPLYGSVEAIPVSFLSCRDPRSSVTAARILPGLERRRVEFAGGEERDFPVLRRRKPAEPPR